MPHKAMAALECVLEHALALELTMLEARPDATEGWAVFVEVRSREESGDFMYAHVFWSEALARSWTRQAAMEWARSRGELLDEPSARQIVSQGEMGRRTFSTVKIGIEPGMFFGCVAYLDLQTSSALAVVLPRACRRRQRGDGAAARAEGTVGVAGSSTSRFSGLVVREVGLAHNTPVYEHVFE